MLKFISNHKLCSILALLLLALALPIAGVRPGGPRFDFRNGKRHQRRHDCRRQRDADEPGHRRHADDDDERSRRIHFCADQDRYVFVTAEFKGFQKVQQKNVTVDVQQKATADITLPPGATAETVVVNEAPPALQTQDASVGQVIEEREVKSLPLNGRNFTFLAQLSAGVTQDQADTRGLGSSGSFAANGLRPAQNNYLLDGLDNNANLVDFLNGTAYAVRPPVDAIQEFKVETNDYSAEMGRSAGAVLNATIKSGSNQYHGSAWEFLRNDKFDAANFFENSGGIPKGEYRQNQFGATFGGPIKQDKTFFFMDYEGTRIRQAVPYNSTVPTALERSSGYTNFSELLTQGGTRTDVLGRTYALGQVFDPSTTRAVTCGVADPVSGITAPCGSNPAGTQLGFVREPFAGEHHSGGPPRSQRDQAAESVSRAEPRRACSTTSHRTRRWPTTWISSTCASITASARRTIFSGG